RGRELDVIGHFHCHGDDVHGRAVHELLMVVECGRDPKELAGGVGRSASRRRERRDLEIVPQRLERGDVRLRRPSPIWIGADDADTDPLGSALARLHRDVTAHATVATSAALTTSTSSASLTSSLTSRPPVSIATFQVSPQSLRLMAALALKPACMIAIGSFA